MSAARPPFEAAFIEQQKRKLLTLRDQLLSVRRRANEERQGINEQLSGQPREMEEEAQRVMTVDLEENLTRADDDRLRTVQRALEKIEQGTYGLSEESGDPIERARLEATPEALYTLEEQQDLDTRQTRQV